MPVKINGIIMVLTAILLLFLASIFSGCSGIENVKDMKDKSAGLSEGAKSPNIVVKLGFETFPKKYTCGGEDISPSIKLSGISENVKSLAIIMDDPDAPYGTFTHWIAWNIPRTSDSLEIPEGIPQDSILNSLMIQGMNDFGKIGYGGPCPPPGKPHRYFLKVYGLDTELQIEPGSRRSDLERAMERHVVQYGETMAIYGK
jgi:hypothetical protein